MCRLRILHALGGAYVKAKSANLALTMSTLVGHVFRRKLSRGSPIGAIVATPRIVPLPLSPLTHHLNKKLPMLPQGPEASICSEDSESSLTGLVSGGVRGYPSANW